MVLTLAPLPAEEYAGWREGVIARQAASPRSRGVPEALAALRAREMIDRHLPPAGLPEGTEVLAVEAGGRRAGTFFLLTTGEAVHLGDLQLADPTDAPTLRGVLVERLRGRGVGTLGVGVTTGDLAGEAFVDGAGFGLVATQMQLDLATAPPPRDPGRVTVRPMTADEVAVYFSDAVETFADETMAADPSLTRERALANAREEHERILPQGADTPGHDFLVALDAAAGRRIGITWLFHEELAAFVYDVEVDEAERGKGYGRALMHAAADHVRGLGIEILGLNVFGHNHVAHALYDALGYAVVDQSFNLVLGER
ncbi:GNAT family N-acetyltransferase [Nocardioides dilutus]